MSCPACSEPPSFTGAYVFTMDAKGRVVMPAAFRAKMGSGCVLLRGAGFELLAAPPGSWNAHVSAMPEGAAKHTLETFLPMADEFDASTGRFLIPHALREWAGIRPRTDLIFIGRGDKVRILPWDRWKEMERRRGVLQEAHR